MAQLFQPTNITPDTRGSFGNGVILRDASSTTSFDVSWQINGNTPMTAFQIDFTNMSGTLIYSTNKITLSTPEYSTLPSGEPNVYSYNVSVSASYFQDISEGLMRITQWWGSGSNDYIVQQSPSHFIVRDTVEVVVVSQGAVGPSRIASFEALIRGADEDGIMWMRWILRKRNAPSGTPPIKDTGRLYGSVEPTFTYDGFLPGNYVLELFVETSVGVQSSGQLVIYISYGTLETGIDIVASRDCNGENAVSIRWPRFQNIPASAIGPGVSDNGISIKLATEDSVIEWEKVNSGSMRFSAPWSVIWCGSVTENSKKLFTIQTSNIKYEAGVGTSGGRGMVYLTMVKGDDPPYLAFFPIGWKEGPFMCCITPTKVYWKCIADKGFTVFPEDSLYPSDLLYPNEIDGTMTAIINRDIPSEITQSTITSVSLHGPSSVEYFEIFDYGMRENEINQYFAREKTGSYNENTWFYIRANGNAQNFNAGNFPETLRSGTNISIYRKAEESSYLEYVGKTTVNSANEILDFAARSQQGPYTYYLYVLSSSLFINVPSVSNQINPCFWDWTVLACTENKDGSYSVNASYRFGKNLQSSQMPNNNQPGVFKNFTPYPTVMISPQNYKSGTLQSLIGTVSDGEYSDTINLRDAIYNLSVNTNTLFLKNRKGDLLRIRPSGEITMETMDNTRAQAQTVSFPWVEIGVASDVAIYSLGGAS